MSVKISLAGDLGSGKSTVSRILLDRLSATYYSTGAICRELATKYELNVAQFNQYMETHPEVDAEIDDGLRALSQREETMVIDSRMAWHFVHPSFRVYMTTEFEESAKRILRDERVTERFSTLEEATLNIKTRRDSEKKRYFELYHVNTKDMSNYDLVVDSTYATPEEVAECILHCLALWEKDNTQKFCYVCPRRLMYPDDELDMASVAILAGKLECMEDLGDITAFEDDGVYYVTEGADLALAYELNQEPLVPAKLHAGQKPNGDFVRMSDTL